MSDARRSDIEADTAARGDPFLPRHPDLSGGGSADDTMDGYTRRMAFMHAMHAGHTSMEKALLRILEIQGEEAPSGRQWLADLIQRAGRDDGRSSGDPAARPAAGRRPDAQVPPFCGACLRYVRSGRRRPCCQGRGKGRGRVRGGHSCLPAGRRSVARERAWPVGSGTSWAGLARAAVRAIYHLYAGWFDGNSACLKPAGIVRRRRNQMVPGTAGGTLETTVESRLSPTGTRRISEQVGWSSRREIHGGLLAAQDKGAIWDPAIFALLDRAARRDRPSGCSNRPYRMGDVWPDFLILYASRRDEFEIGFRRQCRVFPAGTLLRFSTEAPLSRMSGISDLNLSRVVKRIVSDVHGSRSNGYRRTCR